MMNLQQATQTLREKGVVVFPGLYADRSMALAEEHHRCFSESLAGLKLAPPMDGEKILPARAIDLLNHQLTTLHQCLFPDCIFNAVTAGMISPQFAKIRINMIAGGPAIITPTGIQHFLFA